MENEVEGNSPICPGTETPDARQALLEQLFREATPLSGKYEIRRLLGSQPRVPKDQKGKQQERRITKLTMNLNTERRASGLKRDPDESPAISEEQPGKVRKTAPIGTGKRYHDLDRGSSDREPGARRFTGVRSGHDGRPPRANGAAALSSTSFIQPLLSTALPLPLLHTPICANLTDTLHSKELEEGLINPERPRLEPIEASVTKGIIKQLESRQKGGEVGSGTHLNQDQLGYDTLPCTDYAPWTREGRSSLELGPGSGDLDVQSQNVAPGDESLHDTIEGVTLAETTNLPSRYKNLLESRGSCARDRPDRHTDPQYGISLTYWRPGCHLEDAVSTPQSSLSEEPNKETRLIKTGGAGNTAHPGLARGALLNLVSDASTDEQTPEDTAQTNIEITITLIQHLIQQLRTACARTDERRRPPRMARPLSSKNTGTRLVASAVETHLSSKDRQDKVPRPVCGRNYRPLDLDESEARRASEQMTTSPNLLSTSSDHAPQTGRAYNGSQGKLDLDEEAGDRASQEYKGTRFLPSECQHELTMPAHNNPTSSAAWPQTLYVATPPGLPLLPITSLPRAHHGLSNYAVRTRTYPRPRPAHRIVPGASASLADACSAYNQAMTGPIAHQLGDRATIGSNNVHHFDDIHLDVNGEGLDFHHYAMAFGTAANVPAGETHADIRHSRLFIVYELISPQPEHTVMPSLTTQPDANMGMAVPTLGLPVTGSAPAPSPVTEERPPTNRGEATPERTRLPSTGRELEAQTRELLSVSPRRSDSPILVLKADEQSVNQALRAFLGTTSPQPPPVPTVSPMDISTLINEDYVMNDHPAGIKGKHTAALVPSLAYPSPTPSNSKASGRSETIASTSSESWNSSEWRDGQSEDSSDVDENSELGSTNGLGSAPSGQVRRQPNMEHVLDRLTHTLDNTTAPLDTYDIDNIRSESIRSFRAVRRRAEHDGIRYAQDYLRVGPGSIHHTVRAQPSFDEYNHPFRGNPFLYPFERVSLAELREYFHRHPTSDSQRQYENDTDAILLIIDTLLDYHPAASYNLALHSRRIRGLLGPVGGFPPTR